jgi:tetratricopeptide (TPR) repeat protein
VHDSIGQDRREEPLARAASLARGWGGPLVAFVGIVAISLEGGGYDVIVRDGVGIGAWAALAIGLLSGVLPLTRLDRPAWIALALLAALSGWTALSLTWTESADRTFDELARILTYLGVFGLAFALQGPGGSRRLLAAVGAAIAVISALALLSRVHPAWFPPNDLAAAQPSLRSRLNYPLNYWNAVAALVAAGAPLLLALAAGARGQVVRGFSAAVLPILALVSYFTFSRGGAIAGVIGLIAFLAVWRGRMAALPALAASGLGSAALIFFAHRRADLDAGLDTAAARSQGDEMILITIFVCAAVGATSLLGERLLAGRSVEIPQLAPPRRWVAVAAVGAAFVVAALVAGVPSKAQDGWEEFKDPGGGGVGAGRFEAASGNGRYQYWGAAIDAFESSPLTGIGPGTYELWWTRNGTTQGTIRDAHSLYLETLGELGVIGFLLLLGLLGYLLASAYRWSRESARIRPARAPFPDALPAGALGALVAFAIAAGSDWLWEIPALPVIALVIGAAVVARSGERASASAGRGAWPARARLPLALGLIVPIIVIGLALQSERLFRETADDLARGDFDGAIEAAVAAGDLAPDSALAAGQQAYALEQQGALAAEAGDPAADGLWASAVDASNLAIEREPTNWQIWMTRARIEQRRGEVDAAIDAYARARELNPLNPHLEYIDEIVARDPPPNSKEALDAAPPLGP